MRQDNTIHSYNIFYIHIVASYLRREPTSFGHSPKRGTTSEVGGMLSMMTIMKTVIASSTVTARLTFSPLSGGRQNVISPMAVSSTQGKSRWKR